MSTNAKPNASADPPLPCPKCQQQTDSLKQYTVPTVLFIVIAWAVRKSTEVACPSCMRKTVLLQTLINVPTANILWPLVFVPYAGIQLYRTRCKGHSTEIRKRLWPEQYPAAAATARVELGPGFRRFVGFLKIVAGMAATAAIGYFLFEYWYDWGTTIWAFAALGAAGVGVACALAVSGVGSFRTAPFARKTLVQFAVAGAAVFLALAPFAARSYWQAREPEFAGHDRYGYLYTLPPQFWTPSGVAGLLDWKEGVLTDAELEGSSLSTAQSAYDDLRDILHDVKAHHSGDADFQPVTARIEALLEEHERFDRSATGAGGPLDDVPF